MSGAPDNPLATGWLLQGHGTAGMKLLGTYAYLSAQAELCSVGETRAGAGIDAGSIYLVEKARCRRVVFCNYGFGVPRAISLNVLQGFVQRVNHLDGRFQSKYPFSQSSSVAATGFQDGIGSSMDMARLSQWISAAALAHGSQNLLEGGVLVFWNPL